MNPSIMYGFYIKLAADIMSYEQRVRQLLLRFCGPATFGQRLYDRKAQARNAGGCVNNNVLGAVCEKNSRVSFHA